MRRYIIRDTIYLCESCEIYVTSPIFRVFFKNIEIEKNKWICRPYLNTELFAQKLSIASNKMLLVGFLFVKAKLTYTAIILNEAGPSSSTSFLAKKWTQDGK